MLADVVSPEFTGGWFSYVVQGGSFVALLVILFWLVRHHIPTLVSEFKAAIDRITTAFETTSKQHSDECRARDDENRKRLDEANQRIIEMLERREPR